MTLTTRIHCVTDREPAGYHKAISYSINLGIECEGAPDDENPAEQAFVHFLHALPHVEFHVYEIAGDEGDEQARRLGRLEAIAAPVVAALPLMQWLRRHQKPGLQFWTHSAETAQLLDQADRALEESHVRATHLLKGSHVWSAPIAHQFGLTRLLTVAAEDLWFTPDVLNLVLLPHISGQVPSVTLAAKKVGDGRWDVEYVFDAQLGTVVCRANTMLALDDRLPPFLTGDGYLVVNPDAENVRRVIDWFERGWSGLVSGLPAVLASNPQMQAGDSCVFDPVWDLTTTEPTLNAPRAAWRIVAGLSCALDPIVVALLRPQAASGSGGAGDLLLPLINDILDASQDVPMTKLELTTEHVALAIRDLLLASPLLKAAPKPEDFLDALLAVHGIATASESAESALRLFHLLLTAVQSGSFRPVTLSPAEVRLYAAEVDSAGAGAKGFGPDPYQVVMDATHRLHGEAGAEETILRIFNSAAAGQAVGDLLWQHLARHVKAAAAPGDEDIEKFRRRIFASWNSYTAKINGAFNGEEASRRSASADFLEALLAARADKSVPPTAVELKELIERADLFRMRCLGKSANGCFDGIAAALPSTFASLLAGVPAELESLLSQAYIDMLRPLEKWVSDNHAFTADTSPAAMPIQVSALLGASELDDFSRDFNGICVALRRIDDTANATANRWAYAHLARHQLADGSHATGLRQWLPAAQDQRAPMFIDYEGFPFASRTIARAGASAPARPNVNGIAGAFYQSDEAEMTDGVGWAPVPRLIYGRRFEAFSFATTNSGSVPLALQGLHPWLPNPAITAPAAIFATAYQRRTTIGSVAIREVVGARAGRFGAAIPGVMPLASDYPRIALAAQPNLASCVDLLRESDGSGMLTFPTADSAAHTLDVDFADLIWSGGSADIRVEFFDRKAALGVEAPVTLDFADINAQQLEAAPGMTIRLVRAGSMFEVRLGGSTGRVTAPRDGFWWVRLHVINLKDATAIAFADPRARGRAEGRGVPLLLMAPNAGAWNEDLQRDVDAWISAPRVGSYLDFERWYGNADLLARTFDTSLSRGELLMDALLVAYVRRNEPLETDTTLSNGIRIEMGDRANLATMLDRLPDPAVEALCVELVNLDALVPRPEIPLSVTLDLRARMRDWAGPLDQSTGTVTIGYLRQKVFAQLEKHFSFPVKITSTGSVLSLERKGDTLHVNVPAGTVAELRVAPVVSAELFEDAHGHPAVIHKGIAQIARPHDGGRSFIFPGDTLRIETMYDGLASLDPHALATEVVNCRPNSLVREYSVIADGNIRGRTTRDAWRLIGSVAVSTQRWRAGGKPVYRMIDPRKCGDHSIPAPAVPVRFVASGELPDGVDDFEHEIFLGRADEEVETVWKTLEPQTPVSGDLAAQEAATQACTVLQSIPWHAPSATYLRHRFHLRSRYAGALKSEDSHTAAAWAGTGAWNRRMMMLADPARIVVTRPQLRALMPLTTSPHDGGTPPVVGFLQEPPFAEGGLADRIAAELKLGFGFGFSPVGGQVGILDARKEFGPDPRLDYRRTPADEALAIALITEGPIGLTFDSTRSGAPAFANSVVSMTPAIVGVSHSARSFEEHFLGVAMRRYLDPGWLADAKQRVEPARGADCHWIEVAAGPHANGQVLMTYGDAARPLLQVHIEGSSRLQVSTREVDDGGPAAGRDWVDLAEVPARMLGLAVLHSPVAPGRYSASVFFTRAEDEIRLGETNQPVLLASFEWSPRRKAPAGEGAPDVETSDIHLYAPEGRILPCVASAPTFLAWVRTSRDFNVVSVVPVSLADKEVSTVRASDLVARRAKQGELLRFMVADTAEWKPVIPRPSTFDSQFPIHVHRHLCVVGTRLAEGMGKPMNVFAGSAMAGPLAARIPDLEALSGATHFRLVEYESPASILCGALVRNAQDEWTMGKVIPAPYRTTHVDLAATGGSWDRLIRVFIRFVGTRTHLERFKEITLRIERPDGAADPAEAPVDMVVPLSTTPFAVGAELVFRQGADGHSKVRAFLIRSDGSPPAAAGEALFRRDGDSGFLLSLGAKGDGEFWTDLSMLHFSNDFQPDGREAEPTPFDFDLLFSPASGHQPSEAVRPVALANMVEVQARIIAVSPPIPVQV